MPTQYSDKELLLSKTRDVEGCWEWTGGKASNGYGKIQIRKLTCSTHRLAWRLLVGEIPDGMHVLHHCDNRPCCNPDHLFLGTQLDNMRDKVRKDRQAIGETNGNSKLNQALVDEIRSTYVKGHRSHKRGNCHELAVRFNIDPATIGRIVKRQIWK